MTLFLRLLHPCKFISLTLIFFIQKLLTTKANKKWQVTSLIIWECASLICTKLANLQKSFPILGPSFTSISYSTKFRSTVVYFGHVIFFNLELLRTTFNIACALVTISCARHNFYINALIRLSIFLSSLWRVFLVWQLKISNWLWRLSTNDTKQTLKMTRMISVNNIWNWQHARVLGYELWTLNWIDGSIF